MNRPPPEATPPAQTAAFFPPHTWADSVDTFTADWYGKHLRAMGEPSLWTASSRGETAYRFLWLRTWGRPIAVRVTFDGAKAHLYATRLSGDGGYDPGKVDVRRDRDLALGDWQHIEAALASASYDTTDVAGDMGLDGAQWIIERAKGGKYRLVERWTPTKTGKYAAFRAACDVFVDLAGRDLVTGDAY